MILKEHELLQIDEDFICRLREQDPDALAGLSIKLVSDLKANLLYMLLRRPTMKLENGFGFGFLLPYKQHCFLLVAGLKRSLLMFFDALTDFDGHMMTDDYSLYRSYLKRLRCWAHLLHKARYYNIY